jgi:ABC-type cobalamin/Fe3+-siderophores transport system ATPase subunit
MDAATRRRENAAATMPQPLLHARDLSFAYSPDRPVLRGVGLTLAAGEVVALLGPNGSGKSTLIRALLGQLQATAGDVTWDGRGIGEWRRRDLARVVAYLPQVPTFEPEQTVRDVLRIGRAPYWRAFGVESPRDERVVEDVARTLHLDDLLPRRVDQLSGGQRQRVFVGRCLVQEPRAMLLDEPGTFLDLRHQVELLRLLRRLAREQGVGVLLASHDLNVAASLADRLILLDGGSLAADGPPADVLDPALLERVYGVAMDRVERGAGHPPAVLPRV